MHLVIVLVALVSGPTVLAYDAVKHFKLMQDHFRTEEFLRPLGHDFLFDLNLTINKDLTVLIKDAKDAADTEGSTTDKLNAASDFMRKYENTEQNARLKINLGVPIFSFSLFGVRFIPDIRAGVDFGINLGIFTKPLTLDTLIELLPQDTAQIIRSAIPDLGTLPAGGTDLLAAIAATDPGNADLQAAVASVPAGTYVMPMDPNLPNLFVYSKLDVTAGPLINFLYNNIFGYMSFYQLYRRDISARISADAIARDQKILDDSGKDNGTSYLASDWRLGYAYHRYMIMGQIEELPISTTSTPKEDAPKLKYPLTPLYRIHADATFNYGGLKMIPFLGSHMRDSYGWGDGLYAGIDFGAHIWRERLGLQFRTMADSQFWVISPRLRFLIFQLEYAARIPRVSDYDGVKVSAIHSLNFRIFF